MASRRPTSWAVSIVLGLCTVTAHAALTPIAGETFTNLASGNAMAVIQADGTESGGGRLLSNGTPAPAPSNTVSFQTLTIGQLGLTGPADLRVIVAPQESDNVLSSTSIAVQFFSPTGSVLYTATTNAVFNLDTTAIPGQGFVFGLDQRGIDEATAAGAFGSTSNVVGLSGVFINSTDGPETLFGASVSTLGAGGGGGGSPGEGGPGGGNPGEGGGPVTAVPEPDTYALLLAGLMVLATIGRRRRG